MKHFFEIFLLVCFVSALAKPLLNVAESNNDMKTVQSDMINNYYAGPHCNKTEQQLALIIEMLEEIRPQKENKTEPPVGKGL